MTFLKKNVNLNKKNMPYPEEMCAPMRAELTSAGVTELKTSQDVDDVFQTKPKTLLVFINSVCGCAAGSARPGLIMSLDNEIKPERTTTVFAGQDLEATSKAREYMMPYPASSPSIALFQNGELVYFMERHEIEGSLKHVIADKLISMYNQYC